MCSLCWDDYAAASCLSTEWVSIQDWMTVEQSLELLQATQLSRPIGCGIDFDEN